MLAPFRVGNYKTLIMSVRAFPSFGEVLWRYITDRRSYPYRIRIRTPAGVIAPTLYSFHDIRTANEIFSRKDYPADSDARVFVDLGANIGLSALYFASRSSNAIVYAYEPSPVNLERLRGNVAPFASRVRVVPKAVADKSGRLDFNAEPTGRYSGLLRHEYTREVVNSVKVDVLDINEVLRDVISREGRVDILKIDTEGAEIPTVSAADPGLMRHVDVVYLEATPEVPIHPELFEQEQHDVICRLIRRRDPVEAAGASATGR